MSLEVFVVEISDLKILLPSLDPVLPLALRINQKGVALGLGDDSGVLQRKTVAWKTLEGPFRGVVVVDEKLDDVQVVGEWKFLFGQKILPLLQ